MMMVHILQHKRTSVNGFYLDHIGIRRSGHEYRMIKIVALLWPVERVKASRAARHLPAQLQEFERFWKE